MFDALQTAISALKQDTAKPAMFESYPTLAQWYRTVANKDGINGCLASRPDAPF